MPGAVPGATQRAASKFIVFENFKRLNTAEVRQGLGEAELNWIENLQPIADNNWTTVPGPAAAIANIGQTISKAFFGVTNGIDHIVLFTTAGSGWIVRLPDAATVKFAPDGTFSVQGVVTGSPPNQIIQQGPDCTIWQGQFYLINDQVSGYCAVTFDGTFIQQGGVSPVITVTNGGANYTSAPSVTITGGSGSGATAVATISSPGVLTPNGVVLTNPGSGYASSAPGVTFSGGGGSGAVATVTVDPQAVLTLSAVNPVGAYLVNHSGPPPAVTVTFVGGGGSGAGPCTTNLGVNALGQVFVQSINFNSATQGGSGYTSPPAVVFTPNGGLSQISPAVATVTQIGNGQVLSVTVTNSGSGSTSAPAVNFGGGSGSGAAGYAIIGGGSVLSVRLTNPGGGYLPGDVLAVHFSPASTTAATARVWPTLPKGTSIAIFQGRVWLNFLSTPNGPPGQLNGLLWSGLSGGQFDDFSSSVSGGTVISDTDLVHQITGLRSFNNFLWIIGDQSIKQIGNISLTPPAPTTSPQSTAFTILTLSSDQGTTYLPSCVSFNRVFFFANQNGIYAVFGSSVQKVSGDLDGIFQNADFTLYPQGALVDTNNIHCVMWLLRYTGFPTGSPRSIFVVFDGKRWFVASQGDSINVVTHTCSLSSPNWVPYASSGSDLTPLFKSKTTVVTFRCRTSLSHHGNPVQRKKIVRMGYAATLASAVGGEALTMNITTDEASLVWTAPLVAGFQTRTVADPNASGTHLGFNFTGTLAGFTLTNLRIEYQETNIGNQN